MTTQSCWAGGAVCRHAQQLKRLWKTHRWRMHRPCLLQASKGVVPPVRLLLWGLNLQLQRLTEMVTLALGPWVRQWQSQMDWQQHQASGQAGLGTGRQRVCRVQGLQPTYRI